MRRVVAVLSAVSLIGGGATLYVYREQLLAPLISALEAQQKAAPPATGDQEKK